MINASASLKTWTTTPVAQVEKKWLQSLKEKISMDFVWQFSFTMIMKERTHLLYIYIYGSNLIDMRQIALLHRKSMFS